MALQQFRDRQKIIYWIIAIVVIPSFILLGFEACFTQGMQGGSVGSYFGKNCSYNEFSHFSGRLLKLYRYQPSFIGTIDPQRGQFIPFFNQNQSAFMLMALAEDARRHGVRVTDSEVGTFLRKQLNYNGSDAGEFQKRLQRTARELHFDGVFDYQEAARENLLARKFLALIDNSIIIPDTFTELRCAQERAEYVYKRAFVPTAAQKDAATAEIGQLTPEQLLARAETFVKTNQTPEKRYQYAYLWEEPRWKFDYITVPLVVPNREPEITEEKTKAFYEANKSRYADDKGEPLELAAVREKVEADLRQKERLANAQATIKTEVDSFIRRRDRNLAEQDNPAPVTVAEINADPRLKNLALKAGDTGSAAQGAEAIFALEGLQDFAASGKSLLQALDRQLVAKMDKAEAAARAEKDTAPDAIAAARAKALEEAMVVYRGSFHGQSMGKNSPETPLRGENGLLKVRITDYVPGTPKVLRGADGKVDEKMLAAIKDALVAQLALDKTRERAAAVKTAMAAPDGKLPEGIEAKEDKTNMFMMSMLGGAMARLRSAAPGTILDPALTRYPEEGFEILQLVKVNIPDAKALEPQVAQARLAASQMARSNLEYAPENVATPWIFTAERGISYLRSRLDGDIQPGPALNTRDEDAE